MRRQRTYLLFAAKIAISLALLYVAVGFVNFAALRERLHRIDIVWFAAALLVLGVQIATVSRRWQRIAEACGAPLIIGHAILYTLIGSFFGQVLPSTVGGDAARIWFLARDSGAWKKAIFSVLIDRVAGLLWLAVLVLICLPWSLVLIHNPVGRVAIVAIGAAGVAAPAGLFVLSRLGVAPFQNWKATRHLTDIAATAWTVLTSLKSGAAIAAISIVVHLLTVLAVWCCAAAIGSAFTLLNSVLLIPPVILVAAVPVSIAGWGVRESAMLAAFSYAGFPNSDGLLVSLLFGAGSFVIGAAGGVVWAFGSNRIRIQALQAAGEKTLDF